MGSFIAESLREPVNPETRDASVGQKPQPQPQRRPEAEAPPTLEPDIGDLLTAHWAESSSSRAENRQRDWKLAGAAVGALVLAVGLLGALTGWRGGNVEEPRQDERAVNIALPPPKPLPDTTAPSPVPNVLEARREQSMPVAVTESQIERNPSPQQSTVAEDKQPEVTQAGESPPEEIAAGQAVAEAPPIAAVAGNLPLPNAVIARTIERIGYACGQVASTTAVEGEAPGVYKVTCTSGQSYRAAPVRGRYHFRRLGRGG